MMPMKPYTRMNLSAHATLCTISERQDGGGDRLLVWRVIVFVDTEL